MPTRITDREGSASNPSRATLDAAKQESTLQLLFRCGRLLNEMALERLRDKYGPEIRAAHLALLPHVDLEGTRLTEIAARAGVTKQAVAPLVDEMIAMGIFERVADPRDGRASLVRFGAGGRRGILTGLATLAEIEREMASALGAKRVKDLQATLQSVSAWIDAQQAATSSGRGRKKRAP